MTSFSSVVVPNEKVANDNQEDNRKTVHMKILQHSGDIAEGEEDLVFNKVPLYEHYANNETLLSDSGINTMDNLTEQSISPMHESRFRTPNNPTINKHLLKINIGTGVV